MSVPAYEPEDVAAADAALIGAGADLMSVAAHALAGRCARLLRDTRGWVSGARVVLLAGPGNNGGDALYAGALLRRRGAGVTALLCAPRHHEGGGEALLAAGGRLVPVSDAVAGGPQRARGAITTDEATELTAAADLVVDGLLGIGATGAVRGPAAELLAGLPARPRAVVAVDLPSGLDPRTGVVHGPVLAADETVCFGAAKPGLLLPGTRPLVGRLHLVDLGLSPHLPAEPVLRALPPAGPDDDWVARHWPWPWARADKYSRGVLGVAAGDCHYPGAAVLVVRAATGAGVGMVRYLPDGADSQAADHVVRAVPEAVVDPLPGTGRVQAWVVGPGVADPADARVRHVLRERDEPAVVDAGALPGLAEAARDGRLNAPGRLLLTPHRGELARLLDDLGSDLVASEDGPTELPADDPGAQLSAARWVARRCGVTVLLKGTDTLVVAPDGSATVVPGGPPWLASAGAGDVLAGIAGTLLAAGLTPVDGGVLAARVHAEAASEVSGGGPLRASQVADTVATVLARARTVTWDHGTRD